LYTGEFLGQELSAEALRNDNTSNEMGDELTLVRSDGSRSDGICALKTCQATVAKSTALEWLWSKAREEWICADKVQLTKAP
jgi:hypothetical protein